MFTRANNHKRARLVSHENDLTLDELRDRYKAAYDVKVSTGTMCNTLRRMGITRKKVIFRPQEKHR